MRYPTIAVGMLLLSASSICNAQFPWQKPVPRSQEAVARILGPVTQEEPSRDLTIVWVWGVDKLHEKGTHEYAWVMDDYVNLWPREQWDYDLIDAYQKRGGGLIFIHMALMQGSGEELARCIGKAWDHRNGATKWGVLPTPVTLTDAALQSPIFKGFPRKFDLTDEFYWGLRGDPAGITPLVVSPAGPAIANKPLDAPPKMEDLDGKAWPVMWTKEVGRGKVFVTSAGHNYFTFHDPYFRIILLRAMAWAMNESFDPFKPLVMQDIKTIH